VEYKTYLEGVKMIEKVLDKTFSDEQTDFYWVLLKDIPQEDFLLGINVMLRERESLFLPTPADIRKYCSATRDSDLEIRIARAKLLIKKAIGSAGIYTTVIFDDPIIHLIIRDIGGWIKFCKLGLKEYEDYMKWDLPRLYKAYASNKTADIPLYLEGLSEKQNISFIGDREKAEKWIISYKEKYIVPEIDKKMGNLLENLGNKKVM
jgi:hypothetical protein